MHPHHPELPQLQNRGAKDLRGREGGRLQEAEGKKRRGADNFLGGADGRPEDARVSPPETYVREDDEDGRCRKPGGPHPALRLPTAGDAAKGGDARRRDEGRGEEIGRPLRGQGNADGRTAEREVAEGRAARGEGAEKKERRGEKVAGDDDVVLRARALEDRHRERRDEKRRPRARAWGRDEARGERGRPEDREHEERPLHEVEEGVVPGQAEKRELEVGGKRRHAQLTVDRRVPRGDGAVVPPLHDARVVVGHRVPVVRGGDERDDKRRREDGARDGEHGDPRQRYGPLPHGPADRREPGRHKSGRRRPEEAPRGSRSGRAERGEGLDPRDNPEARRDGRGEEGCGGGARARRPCLRRRRGKRGPGTPLQRTSHFVIQPNTASCHLLLLSGLRTQWPSSGKTSASAGTPFPRSAVNI